MECLEMNGADEMLEINGAVEINGMAEVNGVEELNGTMEVNEDTFSQPELPEHSSLLSTLSLLVDENLVYDESRKPFKTNCEVDEGLTIAQSRRFHYRGRAVQRFRPREKVNPVHGLIQMLNSSLRRPPGVNEIVRINPKYDIVLQEKPAEKLSQFERMLGHNGNLENSRDNPPNHYVLRDSNDVPKRGRGSTLWKDPCNANVYPLRFSTLKHLVQANIQEKWPDGIIVPIEEAKEHVVTCFNFQTWISGEMETEHYLKECKVIVLVGVLRSLTPVRDKIIEDTCKRHRLLYLPRRPATTLWKTGQLSDGDGKVGVQLLAKSSSGLNFDDIVSGIPCAVKGFAIPGNGFVVADIAWATPKPSRWPILPDCTRTDIVFVSGLQFGTVQHSSIEMDLLQDYLLGLSGSPMEQRLEIRPKTRVFFVGNSFNITSNELLSPEQCNDIVMLAEKLDLFFSTIAETMEVFLIPGEKDPPEKLLPQKPFQPVLFPRLSNTEMSQSFHNPCRLKMILDLDDPSQCLDLILSSGSNIEEVRKYVGDEPTLFIAENMLKWGHLNPAAPDFFPVENIPKKDVFAILESLPHLYVVGNQDEFGVREFHNSKIVSVPTFAKTRQIVTLQLATDSHKIVPMEFKVLGL